MFALEQRQPKISRAEIKIQQELKIQLNFYDICSGVAGAKITKARLTAEGQESSYFFVCARAVSTIFFPTLTDTATFHPGCFDACTLSAAHEGKG
jgi:hypothetical protein